ncbi:MAG: V-type ATP synthase subunit A [Gemmatimonadota bacterium]|nr:V-type ATP synthase subunit A [Gemmatimonadota bacterium]
MNAGEPRVFRVSGSLVEATPLPRVALYELVRVGEVGLLGEVVRTDGVHATIQVYEDTRGLRVGEPVSPTGRPLEATLGPGLLGTVMDGVGRRLTEIASRGGIFLSSGLEASFLDPAREWDFRAAIHPGQPLQEGDLLGEVDEGMGFAHRVMVPPGVSGTAAEVTPGLHTVAEPVVTLEDGTPLALAHRWPVRTPRPCGTRLAGARPFVTGQRVLDLLFPVAEGGSVALPGGFGTGKTVVEQSLAKFGDADVVVFIGCGERGNEIAELLAEFPTLEDPRTGRSLMERTVLVVNTSNMPVAAREASIYLGMTIGEYYRDMGYRVAVMADSISRWAEALRELGARLQEMPGEEGYPTYLANRLGRYCERAGRVRTTGTPEREGVLTFIGSVSPPGGDLSEPVTQAALRVAGAMWALDPRLAQRRSFPAVDLETSYSLFVSEVTAWMEEHAGEGWAALRRRILELLRRDRELEEIASLLGRDALQDRERFILDAAELIREVVLTQNAFDPVDSYSPLPRTHELATLAYRVFTEGSAALEAGRRLDALPVGELRSALLRLRSMDGDARTAEVDRLVEALPRMMRSPEDPPGTASAAGDDPDHDDVHGEGDSPEGVSGEGVPGEGVP